MLLAKFLGSGAASDLDGKISTWVKDQTLAAIRAVLPDIVAEHGVLAMGQLQAGTASAALGKVNDQLSAYGLRVTEFAELNVNLPEADAQQLKQFAAAKAYSGIAARSTPGCAGRRPSRSRRESPPATSAPSRASWRGC